MRVWRGHITGENDLKSNNRFGKAGVPAVLVLTYSIQMSKQDYHF